MNKPHWGLHAGLPQVPRTVDIKSQPNGGWVTMTQGGAQLWRVSLVQGRPLTLAASASCVAVGLHDGHLLVRHKPLWWVFG